MLLVAPDFAEAQSRHRKLLRWNPSSFVDLRPPGAALGDPRVLADPVLPSVVVGRPSLAVFTVTRSSPPPKSSSSPSHRRGSRATTAWSFTVLPEFRFGTSPSPSRLGSPSEPQVSSPAMATTLAACLPCAKSPPTKRHVTFLIPCGALSRPSGNATWQITPKH